MQLNKVYNSEPLAPPIFIVGSVHTGTTLVSKVLSRHPHVFGGVGESCFFHNLPIITNQFPNIENSLERREFTLYLVRLLLFGYNRTPFDNNKAELERISHAGISEWRLETIIDAVDREAVGNHTKVFSIVNKSLTLIYAKRRWREKTPGHLYHIDSILTHFPDAFVIELVRDPRDILASKRKRRSKETNVEGLNQSNNSGNFDPVLDALSWKAAIKAGNRAMRRHDSRMLRIRYEDFVKTPFSETERICRFVNLPVEASVIEEMIDVGWVNTTALGKHGSRGISTESIAKWKGELETGHIAICQLLAKKEMVGLNYEIEPVSKLSLILLPFQIFRSGFEIFKQIIKRQQRGGSSYSWSKLKNGWKRIIGFST